MTLNLATLDSLLVEMINLNDLSTSTVHITAEILQRQSNSQLHIAAVDQYLAYIHTKHPELLRKESGDEFFNDVYVLYADRATRFLHDGGFEKNGL